MRVHATGFTLFEVIVVALIVTITAALGTSLYRGYVVNAET